LVAEGQNAEGVSPCILAELTVYGCSRLPYALHPL